MKDLKLVTQKKNKRTPVERPITLKLTGMECFWINLALEKLVADSDNFVDEEDANEGQAIHKEFYAQWHPQDENMNPNWTVPKISEAVKLKNEKHKVIQKMLDHVEYGDRLLFDILGIDSNELAINELEFRSLEALKELLKEVKQSKKGE
jgi:hypothetical protein